MPWWWRAVSNTPSEGAGRTAGTTASVSASVVGRSRSENALDIRGTRQQTNLAMEITMFYDVSMGKSSRSFSRSYWSKIHIIRPEQQHLELKGDAGRPAPCPLAKAKLV